MEQDKPARVVLQWKDKKEGGNYRLVLIKKTSRIVLERKTTDALGDTAWREDALSQEDLLTSIGWAAVDGSLIVGGESSCSQDRKLEFTVRLENWSACLRSDEPFRAPEVNPFCLKGKIYGHPHFPDGTEIQTPAILAADGPKITVCGSDELYEVQLGQIDPHFRQWLAENRPDWNPENPVIVGNKV